ncbi:MAG: undecaprenyl/decaprenyl-phosphate alpha-N-acetylglucosaminyl 1-phosphate transferase [Oscillospiraceae bacterium]|jgi:UDP-GlcNAc:undecaprenyl-phosphate GlcNAc-1-phosphate transferase|nr:undecaprenyl/decaprenyl-phosphate alpha-N-acetylglucosaminyl 1-phosphate transferase [Oscillospiraceae bacterium]
MFDRTSILPVIFSLATSMLLSFALTPLVKRLAYKIGAVDIPKDKRRMHDHPIPRLGGLAIFIGFVITVLIFSQADRQLRGILLGACLIVAVGVVDDSHPLGAGIKFILQIVAALIAVWHGVVIQAIASPFPFGEPYWDFGIMAVPITVIWIVAVTNSVNLIDGLDGLADGVSTIAALTMLIIALLLRDLKMAVICAALVGACVGFIPYNRNPAKIFMGDTGATFLGYMLATVSVTGLFKLYAVISFIVPFIILGFPIFDTASAFTRRILKGQNPMKADRSHTHHKLIDMGMNQKQAVATLYLIATVLGLCAVMIVTRGYIKVILSIAALGGVAFTVARIARYPHGHPKEDSHPKGQEGEEH